VKLRWVEKEPEACPRLLADLVSALDACSAVNLVANLGVGIHVYVALSCLDAVFRHTSSSRREVGGLLLGYAFEGTRPTGNADVVTRSWELF